MPSVTGTGSRLRLLTDVSNIAGTARSIEGRRIEQSATPTGQRLVLERLEAIDIILFESPSAPE